MASATRNLRTVGLWALAIVLAAFFLMSGWGKLSNAETSGGIAFDEQFVAWGYPAWFRFVVGATEVLAAVALLVPRVRFYGATVLTATMLGAIVTHLANAEAPYAAIPLVLGLLAGLLAWSSRPAWVAARLARPAVA